MLVLKAVIAWLLILVCAVINGALRESFLISSLGTVAAFLTSGLLLCLCIATVSAVLIPWFGQLHWASYLLLGVFWLCLTLAFEFGFGHIVQRKSWSQLFEPYTFTGGNLWPLVLVVTVFAPLLAAHLRGLPTGMAK